MRSEKGQSTVELALIMPILMLILMGILDFGMTIHTYLSLEHAGREASRAASIGKSDAEITQMVWDASGLDENKITVSVFPNQANRKRGNYATVTISYPIDFHTPLIGRFFPDPFIIDHKTTMRVE